MKNFKQLTVNKFIYKEKKSTPIYLSIYLYSCCAHLEHKASVKRFFHFSFLILDFQ
jgi:hypothetical protein